MNSLGDMIARLLWIAVALCVLGALPAAVTEGPSRPAEASASAGAPAPRGAFPAAR